jgi:vitamin B12 transporter
MAMLIDEALQTTCDAHGKIEFLHQCVNLSGQAHALLVVFWPSAEQSMTTQPGGELTMRTHRCTKSICGLAWIVGAAISVAVANDEDPLTEIEVRATRLSVDTEPNSSVVLASTLEYIAEVDLQTRGSVHGQSDISVRGGIFEGTGIKIGASNLFDPQTGHYTGDVPLPPGYLLLPSLGVGVDNGFFGFNSSVATIDYDLSSVHPGGSATIGIGSDSLREYSVSASALLFGDSTAEPTGGDTLAANVHYAMSRGDGSVANGDHRAERVAARLQYRGARSETDAIVSYQDRFYGWPGAYTGFASFAETDHTKTSLILLNHRQSHGESNRWELGAFYRKLRDDYDFDRFNDISGVPGAFEHETEVYGLALEGAAAAAGLDWHYRAQVTVDELVRSTDLVEGDFDTRSYGSFSIMPAKHFAYRNGAALDLRFGVRLDTSNRDEDSLSPLFGVSYERPNRYGIARYRFEYSETSQLPGYTALKSRPMGLFGGNSSLGREASKAAEIAMEQESSDWSARAVLFARRDDDLVDWTYLSGAPFARQANAVDMDVQGLELLFTSHWDDAELAIGYTYLDKDADYGSAPVDASYYALNYPEHRLVVNAAYRPAANLEIRLFNELREQHPNPLRADSGRAFSSDISISWHPDFASGLQFALSVDNLTNSDFEEYPGTPAPRRQVLLAIRYVW